MDVILFIWLSKRMHFVFQIECINKKGMGEMYATCVNGVWVFYLEVIVFNFKLFLYYSLTSPFWDINTSIISKQNRKYHTCAKTGGAIYWIPNTP